MWRQKKLTANNNTTTMSAPARPRQTARKSAARPPPTTTHTTHISPGMGLKPAPKPRPPTTHGRYCTECPVPRMEDYRWVPPPPRPPPPQPKPCAYKSDGRPPPQLEREMLWRTFERGIYDPYYDIPFGPPREYCREHDFEELPIYFMGNIVLPK